MSRWASACRCWTPPASKTHASAHCSLVANGTMPIGHSRQDAWPSLRRTSATTEGQASARPRRVELSSAPPSPHIWIGPERSRHRKRHRPEEYPAGGRRRAEAYREHRDPERRLFHHRPSNLVTSSRADHDVSDVDPKLLSRSIDKYSDSPVHLPPWITRGDRSRCPVLPEKSGRASASIGRKRGMSAHFLPRFRDQLDTTPVFFLGVSGKRDPEVDAVVFPSETFLPTWREKTGRGQENPFRL